MAAIKAGQQEELYVGNIDSIRDWGYAPEYVVGMWLMLQADEPDDYVLATGQGLTVRQFLEASFSHVDLDWHDYVRFDERYLRPSEVDALIGDPAKAASELGWKTTVSPLELASIMVDHDIAALKQEGTHCVDAVHLESWK